MYQPVFVLHVLRDTCCPPSAVMDVGAHGWGFLLHRWKQDYKACQAEISSMSHSAYLHVMPYLVCMYGGMCACVVQVVIKNSLGCAFFCCSPLSMLC